MKKNYPIRNREYTYAEIIQLDLLDSPFLRFFHEDVLQVVQLSWVGELETLELPHWADSVWTYQYTTDESIPLFMFAKNNPVPIEQLVDMEPDCDPYRNEDKSMIVVPKGGDIFHHYKLVEVDGETRVAYFNVEAPFSKENTYALPKFDEQGERIRA